MKVEFAQIDFTEEYDLIDENYDEITEYQEETQKEGLKRKVGKT